MRTLIIGDIHGGLRALIQLFERAKVTRDDKLIFLGDLTDGWSETAQLIDFAIQLNETHDCIFIQGNHDAFCKDWLKTGDIEGDWLKHGGLATVESYKGYSPDMIVEHIKFIAKMPLFHISKDKDLFIHAGFTSMHGPAKNFHETDCYWDRTLWEMALATDTKIKKESLRYPIRLKLFNEIYIGHTPTTHFGSDKPMHAMNVWNIDTGAAFKGKLSAIDLDTKKIFQSDPVWELYPDENGRN